MATGPVRQQGLITRECRILGSLRRILSIVRHFARYSESTFDQFFPSTADAPRMCW